MITVTLICITSVSLTVTAFNMSDLAGEENVN